MMAAPWLEWMTGRLQPDGVVLRLAVVGAVGVMLSLNLLFCGAGQARIDDVGRGGMRLIAVNGRRPLRADNRHVTVMPVVLVDPGQYTFSVRVDPPQPGTPAETLSVRARVEAGKTYRLEAGGAGVILAEARAPK